MEMVTNLATYNILIHTHNDRDIDQGLLYQSIKALSLEGMINGMKPLSLVDGEDYWSLFFVGRCSKSTIEKLLKPIHQSFFVHKLSDGNLFENAESNSL